MRSFNQPLVQLYDTTNAGKLKTGFSKVKERIPNLEINLKTKSVLRLAKREDQILISISTNYKVFSSEYGDKKKHCQRS